MSAKDNHNDPRVIHFRFFGSLLFYIITPLLSLTFPFSNGQKDNHNTTLTDFSLESKIHARQFLELQEQTSTVSSQSRCTPSNDGHISIGQGS
jgi:hypothetical protein